MEKKIDVVKVISIAGTVLGVTATLLTGWSQQKNIEKNIAEKVSEIANNK
jgi:hypothetical protein